MRYVAQKHFKYTEPQKHVPKNTMDKKKQVKGKLFVPFLCYTR
jgi:hypothetical protein